MGCRHGLDSHHRLSGSPRYPAASISITAVFAGAFWPVIDMRIAVEGGKLRRRMAR